MALVACPECRNLVSTQASACPHCGNPMQPVSPIGSTNVLSPMVKSKRERVPFWKIMLGVLLLFFLAFLIRLATSGGSGGGIVQPSASNQQSATAEQARPAEEASFVSTVDSFVTRYGDAGNEFQKSAVRRQRAAALSSALAGRSIENWVGRIIGMQTNSDGNGILALELEGNPPIKVKTWNNGLSDIEDNTLIPHGSALYNQIANLTQGERVFFSGRFLSGDLDYLKEASLTEEGAMTAPEFLFVFSNVGTAPIVDYKSSPTPVGSVPGQSGTAPEADSANSAPQVAAPVVQEPASQPSEDTGGNTAKVQTSPPPAGRSDGLIERDVVQSLDASKALKSAVITVATERGDVTLSGTVPDRPSRELAETLTSYVAGVIKIHNNLRVDGSMVNIPNTVQPH